MKRSELSEICDKLIQLHIHDLQNELPEIIKNVLTAQRNLKIVWQVSLRMSLRTLLLTLFRL